MRCFALVLALSAISGAAISGNAIAQPGPPPQPPPPPFDTSTTTTDMPDPAPPAPEPAPVPPPPPPPPAPVQQVTEESAGDRPDGMAIGLGIGYALPTSLQTPNITTARLRFASGLQLEPAVTISNTSDETDTGGTEMTTKRTSFGLAALVRLPIVTRGKVDLEVIGTAGFSSDRENPEGDYNTTTTNSFGIGYGVAVSYWLSRHWNLSLSTTNPLVSYDQNKVQTGPDMFAKQSETTIGLIFVPRVFIMIHLYN